MTFFPSFGSAGMSRSFSSSCQLLELLLGGVGLGPEQLPLVAGGLGEQLVGRVEVGLAGDVAAVRGDQRGQLLVPRDASRSWFGSASTAGSASWASTASYSPSRSCSRSRPCRRSSTRAGYVPGRGSGAGCGTGAGTGDDLGRHRQPGRQLPGDRVVVALGDGQHQPGVGPGQLVTRVGGERHEVQVDAGRAHDDDGRARAVGAERDARDGVGQVGAGNGRGRRHQRGQPDERGIVHQAMAQGALAGEAVRARAAARRDGGAPRPR